MQNLDDQKITKLDVDGTFIKNKDVGKTFKQAKKEGLIVELAKHRHRSLNFNEGG